MININLKNESESRLHGVWEKKNPVCHWLPEIRYLTIGTCRFKISLL